MRCMALLALAVASRAAADPCRVDPAKSDLRAMALRLNSVGGQGHVLEKELGTELPAVSDDGSEIAQLFVDEEDFTGSPVTTLVIWSKKGTKVWSVSLGGTETGNHPSFDASESEWMAFDEKALKDANDHLAAHRWRPLAIFSECQSDPKGKASTIELEDGIVIKLDVATNQVTARVGKAKPNVKKRAFVAPGWRASTAGGGSCGSVRGLGVAFGAKRAGFVVVVPRIQLGGDSCFGAPASDQALAIAI